MSTVEKISVALPPEMVAMLREAVNAGEYTSSSEVIRDALREWKAKRTLRHEAVEEIRRLWDDGIASGAGGPLDIEEIKRTARKKFEATRRKARGK